MTIRFATVILLLLGVGALGTASAITGFKIVDAVNAKLPKQEQFEPLGWYLTKTIRLHREYRRLYPTGRLLWRQGIFASFMLGGIVLAGVLMGISLVGITWLAGSGAVLLWFTYFRSSARP